MKTARQWISELDSGDSARCFERDIEAIQADAVESLQTERNAALKLLGYDEAENDLLANITRLKAHYEQELAYLREGEQALMHYCEKLQERVDPKDAIAIGFKELLNLRISRQQDEKTTKPERNP